MDVSESSFQAAVIDRSNTVPVVVDFWAEWCGPCRQLGPVLERAAAERAGKVDLAKVDVDANPSLSRTYAVQSIPAVKAFGAGKVIAEFVGAKPPTEVERFFDSLVPSEADGLIDQGDEASLRAALELDPTRADAALPLARILHRREQSDQALELLERVPGSFAADGLAARIGLEQAGEPDLGEAFAALDAEQHQRALDLLLEQLPRTNGGARDEIRRVVVGVLDELGVESTLARESRRRLAAALY